MGFGRAWGSGWRVGRFRRMHVHRHGMAFKLVSKREHAHSLAHKGCLFECMCEQGASIVAAVKQERFHLIVFAFRVSRGREGDRKHRETDHITLRAQTYTATERDTNMSTCTRAY